MRQSGKRSREIIEIMADVVAAVSADCRIVVTGYHGEPVEVDCPRINYTFGNARYVKDRLDELSCTPTGSDRKFPMIVLFCPFNERRGEPDYYSRADVRLLIACSTSKLWSNEQRLESSFKSILRPIYRRFIEVLKEDGRFDFGYDDTVQHEYSENYSYGRYGACSATGEEVSEPIDAINITNLRLKVKNQNCRTR